MEKAYTILVAPNATERKYLQVGRRRGIMSERFKEELAKELGFYDKVQQNGWGEITAREAGSMVKRAVEIAQESLARDKS